MIKRSRWNIYHDDDGEGGDSSTSEEEGLPVGSSSSSSQDEEDSASQISSDEPSLDPEIEVAGAGKAKAHKEDAHALQKRVKPVVTSEGSKSRAEETSIKQASIEKPKTEKKKKVKEKIPVPATGPVYEIVKVGKYFFNCSLCTGKQFRSQADVDKHVNGKQHKRAEHQALLEREGKTEEEIAGPPAKVVDPAALAEKKIKRNRGAHGRRKRKIAREKAQAALEKAQAEDNGSASGSGNDDDALDEPGGDDEEDAKARGVVRSRSKTANGKRRKMEEESDSDPDLIPDAPDDEGSEGDDGEWGVDAVLSRVYAGKGEAKKAKTGDTEPRVRPKKGKKKKHRGSERG